MRTVHALSSALKRQERVVRQFEENLHFKVTLNTEPGAVSDRVLDATWKTLAYVAIVKTEH